ncbi:ATP-binding cassette domain-containing protein [Lapidilactobacillus bayanensis]|uniref:ATP-binding cassette domain-containing protein n=1 Tax=Lapidilactobacillus bayanensis TaxID=2485998 RepID=UPI000F7B3C0A|nr:ABC transporter ATP-binding protein [Lapidilactobacillus bayanensis]
MRLEIVNLTKRIKGQLVLNQLNLTVDSGELVHIIGANGSGKSTLFKLIVNLMDADDGTITLAPSTYVGALIENPSFMENESVKRNIEFLAKINHNYNEPRIRQLFQLFNLDYDNKKRIQGYSLGMRQKVGIIQSIMENQDLILLDEPTRGLDQEALETFQSIVSNLIHEQKTVIIASHDNLSELPFDRVLKLANGKLE